MRVWKLVPLALMAMAFNVPASAATVTTCGTHVCFSYDDATAFGTGTVIGNNIFFTPTTFKAESLNGEGAVTSNETLNIDVTANAGYFVTNFALAEQGDYFLTSGDTSVDVSGMLAVTSNTTLDPASAIPPFFPDGTQPYRAEDLFNAGSLTNTGALTQWNASAGINLADTAGWNQDTDVTVTVENLLSATTLNLGEQAFVEKKFNAVGIAVTAVPVPGAAVLFPTALAALAWRRRRKTS